MRAHSLTEHSSARGCRVSFLGTSSDARSKGRHEHTRTCRRHQHEQSFFLSSPAGVSVPRLVPALGAIPVLVSREPVSYWLTRSLFLRCLGGVFAVAFSVALRQNPALIGDQVRGGRRTLLAGLLRAGFRRPQTRWYGPPFVSSTILRPNRLLSKVNNPSEAAAAVVQGFAFLIVAMVKFRIVVKSSSCRIALGMMPSP